MATGPLVTITWQMLEHRLSVESAERFSDADWHWLKVECKGRWHYTEKRFSFPYGAWLEINLKKRFNVEEIEIEDGVPDPSATIERFESYANNAASRADAASSRAHQLIGAIPAGQPILVGHHSERRHRADLERADGAMRKWKNELERSSYWRDRIARKLVDFDMLTDSKCVAKKIKDLDKAMRVVQQSMERYSHHAETMDKLILWKLRLQQRRALLCAIAETAKV